MRDGGDGMVACSGGGSGATPKTDGGSTTSLGSGPPGTPGASWGPGATSASQLSALVQNGGRNGAALVFTVQGSDPAGQTTEAQVQLLDASNNPVVAFDTNWDGVADSAQKLLHFDQSTLGQKTFRQTITLPGLYGQFPTIASAVVSLSDMNGKLSAAITTDLLAQGVDDAGGACDPTETADRCPAGLSCSGKPATCQPGTAPTLSAVAYFGGNSPVELFSGADADEDLSSITVNFLDTNAKPMSIDLSGDNDFASSVVLNVANGQSGKSFFFENDPTARFGTLVTKISAVPADAAGHVGPAVVATLAPQPVRNNGQTCDAQGFTACASGLLCSPGIPGAMNTCGGALKLQSDKCKAAPAKASTGSLAAWGAVSGVSLWDPPAGCAPVTETNRPESLVTLDLPHGATTLTVSTATPETDFDTILYVMPSCASSSAQALGCNDDAQGSASTVTLSNVAAGTYTVVVDSAATQGGHFGLSVSVQ